MKPSNIIRTLILNIAGVTVPATLILQSTNVEHFPLVILGCVLAANLLGYIEGWLV